MSLTAIQAQLQAKCTAITGIVSVHLGKPEQYPALPASYPVCVIELSPMAANQLTMGPSGKVEQPYIGAITLYLGPASLSDKDAQTALLPYPDRVRAAFIGADPTMGGILYDSAISEAADNLASYRDMGEYPMCAWRIAVIEHVTVGS